MASTKSLEDMLLSSDIDESAVSALVGSLESQLSSSDAHYPRNDISSTTLNNNHIPNASVADCTPRLPDGQKHGALLGNLLDQSNQNTNKSLVNSQIMGLNSVSSQNLSNAVIVSLPGALPASGYLNQVSSQQVLLNSNRQVSSSGDIKLIYSPHSSSSQFPTSTVVTSGVITTSGNRNNFKIHNGGTATSFVGQTSGGGPLLTGTSPATLSAMQNLANVASQQPRIQVINAGNQQPSKLAAGPRVPVDISKQKLISCTTSDSRHSPNHFISQPASVITSKSNAVNVVTNPNMLHSGVQIVNVNSNRFAQKTLAPRGIVIQNQVRIAPQMIRQGTPIQVPTQGGGMVMPPGMRSALVIRADGTQFHFVNVAPPGIPGGSANSPNTAFRLQSLPGGVPGIIRTLSHSQVVSVPVSTAGVKTLQTSSGSFVRAVSPQQIAITSQVLTKSIQQPVVTAVMPQTTTSIVKSPSNSTTSSTAMSPNTIKKKCQNFLSTLIRLAGDETTKTASNVKKLIQNLIDGTIEPEEFSTQLQKELQSNHQPYLIHFLKRSLPHVRQALMSGEMTIEGIRPPPLPVSMQSILPSTQAGTLRPLISPTRGQLMAGGSALSAQLSQPPTLTQRLISPQCITRPVRPLMGSTVVSSASYTGLMESSPATVGALQSKLVLPRPITAIRTTSILAKDKKSFASVRDEDDINDVAAMGGVNLIEETQRILATNNELVGTQIRSCKDDNHFLPSAIHRKILTLAKKHGLEEVRGDVIDMVSHAAEKRLKALLEKLSIVAEHRSETLKNDPRYEVSTDIKAQIKFLEELDKLEKKRHDDQEKEILLKAAKSRSKLEDPELLKLKAKAKEMQRAEIEEVRQREANMTALLAIGPRKKMKLDTTSSPNQATNSDSSTPSSFNASKPPVRRVKRVNVRDLLFIMENEYKTIRRPLLYKYYASLSLRGRLEWRRRVSTTRKFQLVSLIRKEEQPVVTSQPIRK